VRETYPVRRVPLGGVRGVTVARALPQRALSTVGAWCFLDRFGHGPADPASNINPHPHSGLQTVTWLFDGEIRHRDSIGSDVRIQPGQLNLMTAGRGIAHSEFAVPGARPGRGLQLWIALPGAQTGVDPHFEQHRRLPVYRGPGLEATVLIGACADVCSPALAYTPIVGLDLRVAAGARTGLPLAPAFEHAMLLGDGDLTVCDEDRGLDRDELVYLGTGRSQLPLSSRHGAHAVLLGGEPFGEELVMWWNFVGRDHKEIAAARDDWENHNTGRFGDIPGHRENERIPAPPLPNLVLKPRGNHHPR
jgi:redox-sensitive bicupin YhaK (pirin superfamily)